MKRTATRLLYRVFPCTMSALGLQTGRAVKSRFLVGNSFCGFAPSSSPAADNTSCPFGLLLDIDGVLFRGKDLLPNTRDAVRLLTNKQKQFKVPTVFVTNAGNSMRATKAEQLSDRLGIPVSIDQIVMSHSPLRLLTEYHDKHVLVIGQGPIPDIARQLGFTRTSTLEDLRLLFPYLDCVDYKRRRELIDGQAIGRDVFKGVDEMIQAYDPIEAIVLFGEPIRWESALQYLMDVLITNGRPDVKVRGSIPYPHIPLLACNMDFLWMAETPLPRIANGAFLLMVETLYKKLTGKDLVFTTILGKPAEVTYLHAELCVIQQALLMGMKPPKNLYAIGDTPESDIFGANLFNDRLKNRALSKDGYTASDVGHLQELLELQQDIQLEIYNKNQGGSVSDVVHGAAACYSVLVETGVYSKRCKIRRYVNNSLLWKNVDAEKFHKLKVPTYSEGDILTALQLIEKKERWDLTEHDDDVSSLPAYDVVSKKQLGGTG